MGGTVVLTDDHGVARPCLATRLRAQRDLALLAEASEGGEALRLVARLQPDVLAAAYSLPDLTGLELARRLRVSHPRTRLVLMSAPVHESHLLEALRLDVWGYVCIGADAQELLRAMREASQGRRYLSKPFADRGADAYLRQARVQPDASYERLTPRERELVTLAAQGLTSAKIGERLGIARRTAESHRASALRKLGIANQTELVLYALRRGILALDHDTRAPRPARRQRQVPKG